MGIGTYENFVSFLDIFLPRNRVRYPEKFVSVIFQCKCCGTLITAQFLEDFQSTPNLRFSMQWQCNSHSLLVNIPSEDPLYRHEKIS